MPTPAPCDTVELNFEDVPRLRLGDPRRAQKELSGMNPLQPKFIRIQATATTISILVRTHDSFEKYWDYADRRKANGVTLRGDQTAGRRRGYITEFLAFPETRPEKALRGHLWLDYTTASSYKPGTQIEEDAGYGAGFGSSAPRPRGNAALQADIAGPVDVVMGLNELEMRIPADYYEFQPGETIRFRFGREEVSVCLPS